MAQHIFNCQLLLRRALRPLSALRFRLVIAFPFGDAVLCLHLDDIQKTNLQHGMRQHIVLDFLIGCLAFGERYVHVIQVDVDADIVD